MSPSCDANGVPHPRDDHVLPAHSTRLLEVSPQNAHPGRGSSRAALPARFFSPQRLIKDHRAAASSQLSCTSTFLFGVSLPACLHCGGSSRASSQVTPCYQNNPARLTRSSKNSLQLLSEQSSPNLNSKRSVLCCPTGLSCPPGCHFWGDTAPWGHKPARQHLNKL